MRSNRNSFFTLLNAVFPENQRGENDLFKPLKGENSRSTIDKKGDNEWVQEYYIIYNSYILDGLETAEIIE